MGVVFFLGGRQNINESMQVSGPEILNLCSYRPLVTSLRTIQTLVNLVLQQPQETLQETEREVLTFHLFLFITSEFTKNKLLIYETQVAIEPLSQKMCKKWQNVLISLVIAIAAYSCISLRIACLKKIAFFVFKFSQVKIVPRPLQLVLHLCHRYQTRSSSPRTLHTSGSLHLYHFHQPSATCPVSLRPLQVLLHKVPHV